MIHINILTSLVIICQISTCQQRGANQGQLLGNWEVIEFGIGEKVWKKPSDEEKIVIHFLEDSTFQGSTEYNKFGGAHKVLGPNYIDFEIKIRTDVYERDFANAFFSTNTQSKIYRRKLSADTLKFWDNNENTFLIFHKENVLTPNTSDQ